VEELLVKLEARVKQALERIEELESQNVRLKEANDSLTETNESLREELEQKEEEVSVIVELRTRLAASESKQELARRRIEAIIAELDEILTVDGETPREPVETGADSSEEVERTVPPGIAFPFEIQEPVNAGEEEPDELAADTFPLLDFDEVGELPAEENDGFNDSGEESGPNPLGVDGLTAEEDDLDKDPFGGPI